MAASELKKCAWCGAQVQLVLGIWLRPPGAPGGVDSAGYCKRSPIQQHEPADAGYYEAIAYHENQMRAALGARLQTVEIKPEPSPEEQIGRLNIELFRGPSEKEQAQWHFGTCTGCRTKNQLVKGPPEAELCIYCDELRIQKPPVPPLLPEHLKAVQKPRVRVRLPGALLTLVVGCGWLLVQPESQLALALLILSMLTLILGGGSTKRRR